MSRSNRKDSSESTSLLQRTVTLVAFGFLLSQTGSAQGIGNVAASNVTSNSAVISWTTAQPASSLVNYGVTTSYGTSTPQNPTLTTAHSVTINGLAANTLYNFDVVSAQGGNPASTSSNYNFATLSVSPEITNVSAIDITSTSATITWMTNQPTTAQVNYGATTNYGFSSAVTSTLATVQSITLTGLTPGTTYNFDAVSANASNVFVTSANGTFTTPTLTAPNVGYVAFYDVTNSSVVISWSTDVAANTVVAYGPTVALGQVSPIQPTLASSHGVTLYGLNTGTTYYFVCESTGSNGATGYSTIYSFTTTGPAPAEPVISNVAATVASSSATITWTTDEPSTSQVNYGATTSYGSSSPLDATLTTAHSVTLTGLAANTEYLFQVASNSTNGSSTYSNNTRNLAGTTFWAWGDSLTQNSYPTYLQADLGVPVNNEGIIGAISTQIAQEMLATPASFTAGNCNVIWSGRNNYSQATTVLTDIASMVTALDSPSCFLVLSVINSETEPSGSGLYNAVVSLDASLAAAYPNNFLDIRELMVQDYNPALPMDVNDHAKDTPPISLRAVYTQGTITSGALDSASCAIGVSAGTEGSGTVIIIDSETVLINAVNGNNITACSRGYNASVATTHLANASYSLIDPLHLGQNGYLFVAQQVAAWFTKQSPLSFTTSSGGTGPRPVISNVIASSITSNSAVITWTTDQQTTSLVNYGNSISYGSSSPQNASLTTSHSVTLNGLSSNATYDFDVVSVDSSGLASTSNNYTFATAAAALPPAPIIASVAATNVTATSVTITWTTNQAATAQVSYGLTTAYGSATTPTTTLTTNQSVTITGLNAGVTYNFTVVSANSSNESSTSANYTFTTAAATATPPYVGYVAYWGINNTGVTISWSTDVAANTVLAYGTTPALGQVYTASGQAATVSHGVTLTGLSPGTTYYFVAESRSAANGATGYSTTYSFTTLGTPTSAPGPVISAVIATSITNTSATITWTTDQASSSQVAYGATTSYGSSSAVSSALVTSHSVVLTGLTPGITYDFAAISANSSNVSTTSANFTFTTTSATATPPVISNIQTSALTSTSATITWTTDQTSTSLVNYGTTTAYGSQSTLNTALTTSHSVTLTGLTAGVTYNFDVVSANSASLSTTSGNTTFSTPAANATPPYVGYVAFWGINNSGVTISWSTDVLANTQLAYGTTTALGQVTPVQTTLEVSHGVVLTGLNPGTTYYFVAQSTGTNGATGYSTTYSFTTTGTPVTTPAPVISAVTATNITGTSVTITWTTDQASTSQVNYGASTSYTASSTLNPNLVTSHSVTLTNLTAGTLYNFDVVSANSSAVSSNSANATFQTTGSTPTPVISAVTTSNVTSGTAVITWTTDQATSSLVNYGTTTGYGSSSAPSSTLVTSHSVTLSGLTPNTTYDFDVVSANAANISTTSPNSTFTTAAASATPPIVSDVAFWGVTSSSVVISWSTNEAASTSLAYGTTTALGQLTPVQTTLSATHGLTLTGLAPGTTYYFVAQSADANGNTGYSTTYTFTTINGAPTISSIVATPAGNNTATVSWSTSAPTYSYVQYGTASGSYNRYSAQTSLTSKPVCSLSYVPSGRIYYQVVSTDASGNEVVSPEGTFTEP